jgi:hypothetical protein
LSDWDLLCPVNSNTLFTLDINKETHGVFSPLHFTENEVRVCNLTYSTCVHQMACCSSTVTNSFQGKKAIKKGKKQTGEKLVLIKVGVHTSDFSHNQKRYPREYAYIDQVTSDAREAIQNFCATLRDPLDRMHDQLEKLCPSIIEKQQKVVSGHTQAAIASPATKHSAG